MMDYSLETKRLKLELVSEVNIKEYFEAINSPDVLASMGSFNYPLDKSKMEPILMMKNKQVELHWVILDKDNGELVGGCSLLDISKARNNGEICYWLVAYKRGMGFALEASEKLLEFAFNVLHLHKIWGETIAKNTASKKLLLAIGFREVGVLREEVVKKGIWLDRVRFEILRKEWDKS